MDRRNRIISLLTEALKPVHLELRDTSSQHTGHAGARPEGETHYALVIAAERFRGMSKVQSHRLIYKLLAQEFQTGLHALSIQAKEAEKK